MDFNCHVFLPSPHVCIYRRDSEKYFLLFKENVISANTVTKSRKKILKTYFSVACFLKWKT